MSILKDRCIVFMEPYLHILMSLTKLQHHKRIITLITELSKLQLQGTTLLAVVAAKKNCPG
jgi:hypothetical protein